MERDLAKLQSAGTSKKGNQAAESGGKDVWQRKQLSKSTEEHVLTTASKMKKRGAGKQHFLQMKSQKTKGPLKGEL
jgi:hypothetical protein